MKRIVQLLIVVIVLVGIQSVSHASWLESSLYERDDGGYFTLEDETGRVITYTARILDIGDSYIAADNQRYEVVDIQGDTIKVEA